MVLGGLAETKNSKNSTGFKLLPFVRSSGGDNSKTDILVVLHAEKIIKQIQ